MRLIVFFKLEPFLQQLVQLRLVLLLQLSHNVLFLLVRQPCTLQRGFKFSSASADGLG